MAKRPTPGDVLAVDVPDGVILLQHLGKPELYGDGVLVCPTKQASAALSADVFSEGYVTFYPVRAAVAQGLATVIGHLASPGLPVRFRRRGAIADCKVLTWLIDESYGTVVK